MAIRYLLPCKCGEKRPIDASQAGEEFVCESCGAALLAPTLRGVRQLEVAESPDEPGSAPRNWSMRQGVLFAAGVALTVAMLVVSGILVYTRSQLETGKPEVRIVPTDEQIDDLRAWEVWDNWQEIERQKVPEWQPLPFVAERRKERMINNLLVVMLALAAVGIIASASSIFLKPPSAGSPRPRPTTRDKQVP